jgi:hypothetical protein
MQSSALSWLTGHDDTVAALTNLRTLGWVIKAGAALGSNANGLASHSAIADRLWKYWTQDRADVQAMMMRLAQREASFERSFALTDLAQGDTATFTQRPHELPLRLNEKSNRIEFEHDLAADWARFQFLKQIWTDTPQWAAFAGNPLWTNALRILGQFLLRQPAQPGTGWDVPLGNGDRQRTCGRHPARCALPPRIAERADARIADKVRKAGNGIRDAPRHHSAASPTTDRWFPERRDRTAA